MKLEEIMQWWEEDSIIDNTDLENEITRTGKLHSKYMTNLSKARLLSANVWKKYKEQREWKRRYFRGDFNNADDLKKYGIEPYRGPTIQVEVDRILDSDSELNDILLKKAYYDEIVLFCEAVVKELNNRTYAINGAIKLQMFLSGN